MTEFLMVVLDLIPLDVLPSYRLQRRHRPFTLGKAKDSPPTSLAASSLSASWYSP